MFLVRPEDSRGRRTRDTTMITTKRWVTFGLVALLLGANIGINTLRAQDADPGSQGAVVEQLPTATPESTAAPQPPTLEPRDIEPDAAASPIRNASSANALLEVDAIVAPSEVRAGDLLTYTYRYTNTSGGALTNVYLRATWSNMRNTNVVADTNQKQFCNGSCEPVNVVGATPAYGDADTLGNNIRYTIGSLASGGAGSFSVVLRLRSSAFPRSGISPVRPASSIQIFANNVATAVAQDTISSLIVGPAFKVVKAPIVGSPAQITLGEYVDFAINVGNASAPSDIIDGIARADARPATNVTVTDQFPAGVEYVPTADDADVSRSVSQASGMVTWTIPSLAVQESRTVVLRLRKPTSQSGNASCTQITNAIYSAGANEFPFESTNVRYRVSGDPASMRVVPTVQIAAITFQPNVAYYGETVNAAIRVLNHYTQPVTGARLIMRLPDNVRFQNGSALPASGFTGPGAQQPPQSITWTLNMPAGSASNPAVQTYTLQLKAELVEATKLVETLVQVPSGVPAGCLEPKGEYLRTAPRLSVATTRFPNTLPALISSARPYTFALEVTNNGTITVTDATITAALPFNAVFPAAFSYIPGSSTMNTVPREPDAYVDGNGGHLVWNNIELGPKSLTRFVFEVMPDGFEYVEYCLTGAASSPQDPVAYAPTFALYNCVKVNPPLGMSKTGDRQYVTDMSTPGGREVTFTLMITNTGTHSYFMGLRDYPASQLEFIRQVSSNNGAPTLVNLSGVQELQWPLQTLLPGERLQAVVVFRVPNGGTQLTFRNELGFRFREANNAIVRVSQIPPVEASISQRGTLYFNISTENPVYGPGDRIKYILSAYNTTPAQPMSSISVDNYLPAGFTFESMAVDSDVADLPTQSPGPSGRTALHWNLSSVGPRQTKRVTFYARAASIIGGFESWVNMSSGGSYERFANRTAPVQTARRRTSTRAARCRSR